MHESFIFIYKQKNMSTFREIVYLVLDELKLTSDDATFTENHIIYLINNYRAFLLKQRYSDIKKTIHSSNYMEICLEMEEVPAMPSMPCELDFYYMKSTKKIPSLMSFGNTKVFSENYFNHEIPYVDKDRMRYMGYNRFIPISVFASKGSNECLYLKSNSIDVTAITSLKMYAVFQDAVNASELLCDGIKACDILDREFPLEEALIPPLVELTVKELSRPIYAPEDKENNADDNLSEVMTRK